MQVLADAYGKFNSTMHRNEPPTWPVHQARGSRNRVAFAVA